MPVLTLKAASRRRRPVACDAVRATVTKSLANIPSMLRAGDPNGAFPSGDVAGAVAFAYPLWRAVGCRWVAVGCVAFSAAGRMYWLAHHLIDVVSGAVVGLLACALLDATLTSFVPSTNTPSTRAMDATTSWWSPLAAFAVLVAYAKSTGVASSAPVKQRL